MKLDRGLNAETPGCGAKKTVWKSSKHEGEKVIKAIEKAISEYDVDNENKSENSTPNLNNFLNIEKQRITSNDIKNPYGFEKFVETDIYSVKRDKVDNDFTYISKVITEIVKNEYHIHFDLICKKTTSLFGFEKVSKNVKEYILNVLNTKLSGTIINKDDYYFPKNYKKILIRVPNIRTINYIYIPTPFIDCQLPVKIVFF
jgi:hypothetical protein